MGVFNMPSRKAITPFEQFEGNSKQGHHIRITKDMMRRQAWIELSPIGVKLYLFLKSKYRGKVEGSLFQCTYKEIRKAAGFFDKSIKSAFDDLIMKGFIEINQNNQARRLPNIYRYSDKWQYYGNPEYEYLSAQRKVVIHAKSNS
jgi:hypothetical protein